MDDSVLGSGFHLMLHGEVFTWRNENHAVAASAFDAPNPSRKNTADARAIGHRNLNSKKGSLSRNPKDCSGRIKAFEEAVEIDHLCRHQLQKPLILEPLDPEP